MKFRSLCMLLCFCVAVQASAAWAGGGGWPETVKKFQDAIASKKLETILDAITEMEASGNPDAAQLLIDHCLLHDDLLVHQAAFDVLTRVTDEKARKAIVENAAKNKSWETRSLCTRVLASHTGFYIDTKLRELATKDKVWQVRSSAIRALTHQRQKPTIPFFIELLESEKIGRVLYDIVAGLEDLTAQLFGEDLVKWKTWWAQNGERFVMPSAGESSKIAAESKRQSLITAVRDGLYGPIYSERVVFVFDRSGSMGVSTEVQESRVNVAKQQLEAALGNLSPKGAFNILAFSNEVTMFEPKLQKVNPANLKDALEFISKITAGGETNVYGALKAAFADPDVDTIYFLTDGSPTVGEQVIPEIILRDVADWNRRRRIIIHTVGFFPGDAKNEDKEEAQKFLMKLAHENDGFYKEIY